MSEANEMDVKPKPKRGRPAKVKEPVVTMSDLAEALKGFAQELKAPTPKQLAEEQEEARKKAIRMKQMIELATVEINAKKQRQASCGHVKQDGSTLFQGQIHSDGLYHPLCMRCGKEGKPQAPPRELLAQGLA